MAKKLTVRIEREHLQRIDTYARKIDQLYLSAIREAASIGFSISDYDPSKPFTWSRYPQTKARIDKVINSLFSDVTATLTDATRFEWLAACMANDKIVNKFFNNPKLRSIKIDHYYQRNLEALEAFQKRKMNGLNLSDRIWKQSQQFRNELEMCLDIGLSEGRSAAELSRDIRQYLNEPKKLYRRIKNKETGQFYLSKNAKKYNPQSGMYRSSYKNALRVTRTETNMAYRASDIERWNQLDFVVGYEIKRSNHVFSCKVCEALAGRYPKTFKFNGWHPNCYDDQSEVLTNRGWQFFKDVKDDDLILSLNPETKDLEWTSIVLNFNRKHKGKMVHFSNKTLDCLVTPEHEMVYINKSDGKIKRCSAESYTKGKGGFYRSSEYKSDDVQFIDINGFVIDFDTYCEFMGYWLADGSLIRNSQIKIAQKDGDANKENILNCVNRLGINTGTTKESVDCYSAELNSHLRRFGLCYEKYVPEEIKNSSPRQIKIFLDAFISCDGSIRMPKSFVGSRGNVCNPMSPEREYFTTSKQLASDIGELLLKVGKRPSYYIDKSKGKEQMFSNGLYVINHDLIRIRECAGKTSTTFAKKEIEYDGLVYDLTLAKNSIMYIRRNGTCYWGSNCRCFMTSILATPEEFIAQQKRILAGEENVVLHSKNEVKDLPSNFKFWVKENSTKIATVKSTPYFLKDNFTKRNISNGLAYLFS